jgi:hypothetical protein
MDDTEKQSLAWARFQALRGHPPDWDVAGVSLFHEIVSALEEAFAADLSSFRVPSAEMKQRVVGGSLAPRSGRFPARKQMSDKLYCDEHFVQRQIDGIVFYFQNLQPSGGRQKFGF